MAEHQKTPVERDNIGCATHACASVPKGQVKIKIDQVLVPEYHVGSIPADMVAIYKFFGLRYVEMRKCGAIYFVHESVLKKVADEFNLYV